MRGADADATIRLLSLFDTPSGPATIRLVVAYDGTGFRGFAKQAAHQRTRTVAGVLGSAIEKVLRHSVDLVCAGRTDAGVHARGQVVSFEADPGSIRGGCRARSTRCSDRRSW